MSAIEAGVAGKPALWERAGWYLAGVLWSLVLRLIYLALHAVGFALILSLGFEAMNGISAFNSHWPGWIREAWAAGWGIPARIYVWPAILCCAVLRVLYAVLFEFSGLCRGLMADLDALFGVSRWRVVRAAAEVAKAIPRPPARDAAASIMQPGPAVAEPAFSPRAAASVLQQLDDGLTDEERTKAHQARPLDGADYEVIDALLAEANEDLAYIGRVMTGIELRDNVSAEAHAKPADQLRTKEAFFGSLAIWLHQWPMIRMTDARIPAKGFEDAVGRVDAVLASTIAKRVSFDGKERLIRLFSDDTTFGRGLPGVVLGSLGSYQLEQGTPWSGSMAPSRQFNSARSAVSGRDADLDAAIAGMAVAQPSTTATPVAVVAGSAPADAGAAARQKGTVLVGQMVRKLLARLSENPKMAPQLIPFEELKKESLDLVAEWASQQRVDLYVLRVKSELNFRTLLLVGFSAPESTVNVQFVVPPGGLLPRADGKGFEVPDTECNAFLHLRECLDASRAVVIGEQPGALVMPMGLLTHLWGRVLEGRADDMRCRLDVVVGIDAPCDERLAKEVADRATDYLRAVTAQLGDKDVAIQFHLASVFEGEAGKHPVYTVQSILENAFTVAVG